MRVSKKRSVEVYFEGVKGRRYSIYSDYSNYSNYSIYNNL